MATSNTLTGIIPTLYEAMNIVSREMVGFIPAVRRDSNAERAALNQTVRSPIGVSGDLEDVAPGQQPANSGGTTVGYVDVAITKSKAAPILWSGEEQKGVGSSGTLNEVLRDQFADGMRKLVNAIEIDIAVAAKTNSSRAYGTAGSSPFGTAGDLSDVAGVRKILEDNGAPTSDLQLVLNSGSIANLRGKQSILFKVNEAGSQDMLRSGMTDRLEGFALRNSAGIKLHTKGGGTSYVLNGGVATGRDIVLKTGNGTVLEGDIITVADDPATAKYVVNKGVAAAGTITIGKPGVLGALVDGKALTIGDNYTGNYAFDRNSIVLVARAPALPEGGDSADDRTTITDPVSGLSFEVSVYRQYRQVKYEIALAWGVGVPNGAHLATLLG